MTLEKQLDPLINAIQPETSRAQGDAETLRHAATLDAFRVRLTDTLRPLSDPVEIQSEASRLLGELLALNRVLYVEIVGEGATVHRDYANGVPSIKGQFWLKDFGSVIVDTLRAGETLVVSDITTKPGLSETELLVYAALRIKAFVAVPLVKAGQWVAMLGLYTVEPRVWSSDEIMLAEEVAERTWAAVERAHAEAALRASEQRLQLSLSVSGMGIFVWYPAEDRTEADARMLAHMGLPEDGSITLNNALTVIIHPDDRARYAEAVAQAIDPAGTRMLQEEIRFVRPDGSERWIAVTARAFFEAGMPRASHLAGVTTDVTERKRRELNIAFLTDIQDDLADLTSSHDIMQAVGRKLGTFLNISSSFFVDVDEGRDEARIQYGWNTNDVPKLPELIRLSDYLDEQLSQVFPIDQLAVINDSEADPRFDSRLYTALKVRSALIVPFHRDNHWKFALAITDSHLHHWRDDEIELFRELSNRVFPRLERARAEAAEREQRQLAETLRDTALALTSSLDFAEVSDHILANIGRIVPHDAASLLLLDGDVAYVERAHGYGQLGAALEKNLQDFQISIAESDRIDQMLRTKSPVLISDWEDHGVWDRIPGMESMHSLVAVPILERETVIGFLKLHSRTPNFFIPEHARLLQAFATQAAIAIQNAHAHEDAQALAVINERHRLARELHDAVTQTLFSANVIADSLPLLWAGIPDPALMQLEQLQMLTRGALAEMRTLLLELRPEYLTNMDLEAQIRQLLDALRVRKRMNIQFTAHTEAIIPNTVRIAFYRIAQEALNNIVKHAHATEVQVTLEAQHSHLQLVVQDNGVGFAQNGTQTGLGLKFMTERADEVGAQIEIATLPKAGTRIGVTWGEAKEDGDGLATVSHSRSDR